MNEPAATDPVGREGVARHLLISVTQIADRCRDPARRRREVLRVLRELTQADLGWWAWGHGGADGTLLPVAVIEFGACERPKGDLLAVGMAPELDEEFRQPVLAQMGSRSQWTSLRRDIYCDVEWPASHFYRLLHRVDACEWVHCIRYEPTDRWSNVFFMRRPGQPPFDESVRATVDLAMASISWLRAQPLPSDISGTHRQLTARQRTVLTMLLDGRSRKQIAGSLGISEETVGDHLKSIYRHYQVKSAGELSALFLQGHK